MIRVGAFFCEERGGEAGRHSAEARLKVKRVTYTLSICGRESCCSRPKVARPAAEGSAARGRKSITWYRLPMRILKGRITRFLRRRMGRRWGLGRRNNELHELTNCLRRRMGRQHCSSLCSQSEGHEHVANMVSASEHDFVGFLARAWPPQYSSPSLCEQSELQCWRRIYGIWCCAENAEYGAGAANAGYSVALQSFPLRLYPIFRAGKKNGWAPRGVQPLILECIRNYFTITFLPFTM